ncbi:MAG TPA: hypothetical protein VHC43_15935 [Mycobacteriales bacterium]|nr:hypothetical protein [Mycobacteriales bacterium]
MGAIRTIPRTVVNGYLRALRLPLSAAERVARQQDNDTWAPAITFERLEAKIEGAAGFLLRDEDLLLAAQMREEKLAKLQEASTLKAAADVERDNAHDKQRARQAKVSEQRAQTRRAAAQRKDAIKADAEQKKRSAESDAATKERGVQAQKAAQETVIDRRERASKAEALRAESEALDLTDEALAAREKVDLIDETIEGNKEARKTG